NSYVERLADEISCRGGRYLDNGLGVTDEQLARGARNPDCVYVFRTGKDRGDYEVPYRLFLPRGVEGLLVAGKASAGGLRLRAAHGLFLKGQAAGTAAALAARADTTPRRVDVKQVQALLKKGGVDIPY